jgi:hypothetical protein
MTDDIYINKNGENVLAKGKELEYLLEWQSEAHASYEALINGAELKQQARESALAKLSALGLTDDEIASL